MKKLVLVAIVIGVAMAAVLAVVGIRTYRRIEEQWTAPGAQTRFIGPKAMNKGVGLVELHRARYGRYPATLSDLTFLGGPDRAELGWLEYASSEDGSAYFLAVARDFHEADEVTWPTEYWEGTGYEPALRSAATRAKRADLHAPEPTTFGEGFADLHLSGVNLAVGQIELHKLRYGRYPVSLDDLRFMARGDSGPVLGHSMVSWKNPSLAVIDYALAEDGLSYRVRIRRPLAGTAPVGVPDEYWRGTGHAGPEQGRR